MLRLFSTQDAHATKKQRFMKGGLILIGTLFMLWLIVWLLPTSTPPPVRSDAAGTVATQSEEDSPTFQLLTPGRVLVVLLLVGGGGYAIYLRRRSGEATSASAPMHALGHLPLTQDQQLKLVNCQDEVLLLGISPNEITLLRTYPRTAFAEAPPTEAAVPPDEPIASPDTRFSGFADVLRQYTSNGRHA